MQVEAGRGVCKPAAGTECGVSSGASEFGDVAGEPATSPAIAPARSPPVEANAQQYALEAVEAIPEIEFDQTANLIAEARDYKWTSPVDAEPIPELEFDQTLGC